MPSFVQGVLPQSSIIFSTALTPNIYTSNDKTRRNNHFIGKERMIRHNFETDIIFWPTRFLNGEYLFYLWTARQLFLAPSQKYRNISKSCSDEVFEDLTTEILLSANCQSNLAEYHPIDTYMNMCVRFKSLV
jgi:hypothetical protein